MLVIGIILLFLAAFLPGLFIIYTPQRRQPNIQYMLVFAGAFIFSITLLHLLPELMTATDNPRKVGLFVLLGFIMQVLIDFATSGVEHGHLHHHSHHGRLSPILLMSGLCIHALMDGSILVHPGHHHETANNFGLLASIMLHKIPESIALISVLSFAFNKRLVLLAFLLIFSLASPIGLMASDMLSRFNLLDREGFVILFSIISGNLLHISTTIYFETSPNHSFHKKRALIGLLGIMLAIVAEFM